jgi:transcriptional regulator with XRE-family HTH domain
MLLAKILKRWRETEHRTLRQMAFIIGVDYTTLWRFEQGRSISGENWVKIAKYILTEEV